MPLHENDDGPEPKKWRVQKLKAKMQGPDRVLEMSLHVMSVVQKLKAIGVTALIKAPERTRYMVEVSDAQGNVVERLEGARLRVRRDAKHIFLLDVLPSESPMKETAADMKMINTVADTKLPKPKKVADLPPEARKGVMAEFAVRAGIGDALREGKEWAGKLFAIFLQKLGKQDPDKKLIEQRELLNDGRHISLRDIIEQILSSEVQDMAQVRYLRSIFAFCKELADGATPAAAWAKKLLERVDEPADVSDEKQAGVASGRMPSAMRVLDLLKGSQMRHVAQGFDMLEDLLGSRHYVAVAASNAKEREALDEIKKIHEATRIKGKTDTEGVNMHHVKIVAADRGLSRTEHSMRKLVEVRETAEQRAKKPAQ